MNWTLTGELTENGRFYAPPIEGGVTFTHQGFAGFGVIDFSLPDSCGASGYFSSGISFVAYFANCEGRLEYDVSYTGRVTSVFVDGEKVRLAGFVPEPSTWAMMVLGFGAAGAAARRRRKNSTVFS